MSHGWQCPTCGYQLLVYQARCPRCAAVLTDALAEACRSCRVKESCGPVSGGPKPREPLLWAEEP